MMPAKTPTWPGLFILIGTALSSRFVAGENNMGWCISHLLRLCTSQILLSPPRFKRVLIIPAAYFSMKPSQARALPASDLSILTFCAIPASLNRLRPEPHIVGLNPAHDDGLRGHAAAALRAIGPCSSRRGGTLTDHCLGSLYCFTQRLADLDCIRA